MPDLPEKMIDSISELVMSGNIGLLQTSKNIDAFDLLANHEKQAV